MMLDLSFFSTEVFKFVLFLAGISALTRPFFGFVFSVILDESTEKEATVPISRFQSMIRVFLLLGFIAVPFVSLVISVFGVALSVSFLSAFSLSAIISLFFYVAGKKAVMADGTGFLDYLRASVNPKSYLSNPALLAANASLVLMFALASGYYRTLSLALSETYCVETLSGPIEGALVARTDDGLILAKDVEGRWTPFTLPAGLAVIYSDVFIFVYADDIRLIAKCV